MTPRVLALCGGVGGAKLALGLDRTLAPGALAVVVNTGDDFEHHGLSVSPDVDTVLYTLGNRVHEERGWGRADETWHFRAALEELGGDTWFALGDRDLALHVLRTSRLARGEQLTAIVADLARRFGIKSAVLPMSDAPVRTVLDTDEGSLPFQEYFVRRQCKPVVRRVRFEGAAAAGVSPELIAAFASQLLEAIVICPSNPYLSIDPLLATQELARLLRASRVPIVAVTPLINGAAIKGPTTKLMSELGIERTPASIALHYGSLIDGFVLDARDRHEKDHIGMPVLVTNTLMTSLNDRDRLATEVLEFAQRLPKRCADRSAATQARYT